MRALCSSIGTVILGFFSSQPISTATSGAGALMSESTVVSRYTVWHIYILSAAAVFFFAVGLIFFMKNRSLR